MDLGTEMINYILQFNSLAARNENYCDYFASLQTEVAHTEVLKFEFRKTREKLPKKLLQTNANSMEMRIIRSRLFKLVIAGLAIISSVRSRT